MEDQTKPEIFISGAYTLLGFMRSNKGDSVTYKIPSYQRTYDWGTPNIEDLVEKCLAGFKNLSMDNEDRAPSYTFLGTIIVVADRSKEEQAHTSYEIVDGQQRLTTLTLIICSLIGQLQKSKGNVGENIDQDSREWIEKQIDSMLNNLLDCILRQKVVALGKVAYFPKIIRGEDSPDAIPAQYNSTLASFIEKIYTSYDRGESIDDLVFDSEEGGLSARFFENYQHIKNIVSKLSTPSLYKDLDESEMVDAQLFNKDFMINQFIPLDKEQESKIDLSEIVSRCIEDTYVSSVLRTILFSAYLMKYVVLVSTEAKNNNYAFDMFDSLNTTGELLTGLDTLKPLVVQLEEENTTGGYDKSLSKEYLDNVHKFLEDNYPKQEERQAQIKDFVVSLAVYLTGYRLSKGLKDQRHYLRNISKDLENTPKDHENFIKSISDFSDFRNEYWIDNNIKNLDSDQKDVQTCMKFILEMNTTLCLPIIARYQQNAELNDFISATKALAAFLAIRRGYTRGTEGIDAIFRGLMVRNPKTNTSLDPLCTGLNKEHEIWSINDLKNELNYYIKKILHPQDNIDPSKKISIDEKDREKWINAVSSQPLAYGSSKALCRFFILIAAHEAKLTKEGLWVSGSRESDKEYLSYDGLSDTRYKTIEHVAPQRPEEDTWPQDIYTDPATIHTLGNLILLPLKDNMMVGNLNWIEKKKYYAALSARTTDELAEYDIKKPDIRRIASEKNIALLEFAKKINDWNLDVIKGRSENIAERAWDTLIKWL